MQLKVLFAISLFELHCNQVFSKDWKVFFGLLIILEIDIPYYHLAILCFKCFLLFINLFTISFD